MNFTREPIIETIISAKEGYKLSLKSSKSGGSEEYLVDAVEVVSFGGTFFYRCQERPRAFFLPTNDYEIVEVRETRLSLKTPVLDKSVKIAGGTKNEKTASDHKKSEEMASKEREEDTKKKESGKTGEKKEKKRTRRSKKSSSQANANIEKEKESVNKKKEETKQAPLPTFSHLLTPPEGLISDTLQKYKNKDSNISSPDVTHQLTASFSEKDQKTSEESIQETSFVTEEDKAAADKNNQKKQAEESLKESIANGHKETITDKVMDDQKGDSTAQQGKKDEISSSNLGSEAPKPKEQLEDKDPLEELNSTIFSSFHRD